MTWLRQILGSYHFSTTLHKMATIVKQKQQLRGEMKSRLRQISQLDVEHQCMPPMDKLEMNYPWEIIF